MENIFEFSTAVAERGRVYRAMLTTLLNIPDALGMTTISKMYEVDFPQSALPKYFRGRAYQMNNQLTEAYSSYKECIALLPSDLKLSAADKAAYISRCENLLKEEKKD